MTIPAAVEELEPAWFSEVLGMHITGVEVLDAHSGTTGRARVGLTGAADEVPGFESFQSAMDSPCGR